MTVNYKEIKEFLTTDIWKIRVKQLPHGRALLIRALRVLILTFRGLTRDRWQQRASALTYYSMLSIVPALAMAFGIAKGFGLEEALKGVIYTRLEGQEEVVDRVLDFSRTLLENVRGGLMAAIGLAILFFAIFRLLAQIERALNDVWGIRRSRSTGRKIIDYLAIALICPFFLIVTSTINVFINSNLQLVIQKVDLLGAVGPLIFLLLTLMPYLAVWITFAFIYKFMPNTEISLQSSILASIIAGTAFQLFQGVYIKFQLSISSYNTVYGSFAALPLFIIWLQISWLIVLIGAGISSAHQNVDSYEYDPDRLSFSDAFKQRLALVLMHHIIKRFIQGEGGTVGGFSRELEVPAPLINRTLSDMAEAGLVSEVIPQNSGPIEYRPALDTDLITIKLVIDRLEHYGSDDLPLENEGVMRSISEGLEKMSESAERSDGNRLLKTL